MNSVLSEVVGREMSDGVKFDGYEGRFVWIAGGTNE